MSVAEKKTLNHKELMETLGIGWNKAHQLLNDKSFYPAFRIGRRVLVNVEMLDRWLAEQCHKGV